MLFNREFLESEQVPIFQIAFVCHSEFISGSRISNIVYKRLILKQVQDDNGPAAALLPTLSLCSFQRLKPFLELP
jgi:hypothetical protein